VKVQDSYSEAFPNNWCSSFAITARKEMPCPLFIESNIYCEVKERDLDLHANAKDTDHLVQSSKRKEGKTLIPAFYL
jgi:hypothetical protein